MLTASFHNPYDPLQGNEWVPQPVHSTRVAVKIALGILGGVLLAAAGSLDPKGPEGVDRLALGGEPPQVVAIEQDPWGQAPRREEAFSH